ncbi:MAG: archease [Thermodesulfobacteriota bacterium]
MEKFRYIDHTGDLGVEVFGDSLRSLFQHAGEAFTDIITEAEAIGLGKSKHIDLLADRVDDLMVYWLNEFVFLFDTEGFLPKVFDIVSIDESHIEAAVQGETYDEQQHPIKTAVKGATYHQLEVVREGNRWKARIIFDL